MSLSRHPADNDNQAVALQLERVAQLLDAQGGSPFRARAYQRAAETVRGLSQPLSEIAARGGASGLEALPAVGPSIASAIMEILDSGRLRLLARLEGETCPAELFASVPGMGPTLAQRVVDTLHLESLEELELAAHDGRLATVPGLGARRIAALRDVLDGMLRRRLEDPRQQPPDALRPSVDTLLELDAEYRDAATREALPKIAPRRFNPRAEVWLPIMHRERSGYHLTALYSNTARAHRLGKTHDWVVIFYDNHVPEAVGGDERPAGSARHHDGQCTVVTEHTGPLAGKRVVRGREHECAKHYAGQRQRL